LSVSISQYSVEPTVVSGKWVLSVILPGIRPQILGDALEASLSGSGIGYNDKSLLLDVADETIHPADRAISVWAHRHRRERLVVHARELSALWQLLADDIWITIIGDPIWRAVDCFRNLSTNPAHPLHAGIVEKKITLGEFYRSPLSLSVCNRQCRKLALTGAETSVDLMLTNATKALKQFAWIGLEGVDAGPQKKLGTLLQQNGYPCAIPVLAIGLPPKKIPDPETQEIIRKAEAADCALWEKAREMRAESFAGTKAQT